MAAVAEATLLAGFAFAAGAAAFLNPCGVALLPAYVALYLGVEPGSIPRGGLAPLFLALRAALLGLLATAGFMAVFLAAGAVMGLAGLWLIRYVPLLALALGAASLSLGLLLAAGRAPWTPRVALDPSRLAGRGVKYFPLFGVAYAVASLSCTAPIFIYVALQALAAGGLTAAAVLAAYSLGMGSAMTVFTLLVTFASGAVRPLLAVLSRHYHKLAGLAIAAGGAYIVYWQAFAGGLIQP